MNWWRQLGRINRVAAGGLALAAVAGVVIITTTTADVDYSAFFEAPSFATGGTLVDGICIHDTDLNTDKNSQQSFNLTFANPRTGEFETATFNEAVSESDYSVSINSSWFCGSFTTEKSFASSCAGALCVRNTDRAESTYTDAECELPDVCPVDRKITVVFSVPSELSVSVAELEVGGPNATITLGEMDRNADPAAVETVDISATRTGPSGTAAITVRLTETGVNTGIFTNALFNFVASGCSSTVTDPCFNAQATDTVAFSYTDLDPAGTRVANIAATSTAGPTLTETAMITAGTFQVTKDGTAGQRRFVTNAGHINSSAANAARTTHDPNTGATPRFLSQLGVTQEYPHTDLSNTTHTFGNNVTRALNLTGPDNNSNSAVTMTHNAGTEPYLGNAANQTVGCNTGQGCWIMWAAKAGTGSPSPSIVYVRISNSDGGVADGRSFFDTAGSCSLLSKHANHAAYGTFQLSNGFCAVWIRVTGTTTLRTWLGIGENDNDFSLPSASGQTRGAWNPVIMPVINGYDVPSAEMFTSNSTGADTTRPADAHLVTDTNMDWEKGGVGNAILWRFRSADVSDVQDLFRINDGTSDNRYRVYTDSDSKLKVEIRDTATTIATLASAQVLSDNVWYYAALSTDDGDWALSVNGETAVTHSTGNAPDESITQILWDHGEIREKYHYDCTISNADLATYSTGGTRPSACKGGGGPPPPAPLEYNEAATCGGNSCVVVECESTTDLTPVGAANWSIVADGAASGGNVMQAPATPNDATVKSRFELPIKTLSTGTYYLWVRGRATSGSDDSLFANFNADTPVNVAMTTQPYNSFYWFNATSASLTAGSNKIQVHMREVNARCDQVLATPVAPATFTPSGAYAQSSTTGQPGSNPNSPTIVKQGSVNENRTVSEGSFQVGFTVGDGDNDSLTFTRNGWPAFCSGPPGQSSPYTTAFVTCNNLQEFAGDVSVRVCDNGTPQKCQTSDQFRLTIGPGSEPPASTLVKAFSTATGVASLVTTGGRGGSVCKVTNLSAGNTAGSFSRCLTNTGARHIVFDVGGTIRWGAARVGTQSNVSIYGHTAPGYGIQAVKAGTRTSGAGGMIYFNNAGNAIIRFLKMRHRGGSNNSTGDIIGFGAPAWNVMIDHITMAWDVDGVCDSAWPRANLATISGVSYNKTICAEGLNQTLNAFHGAKGMANSVSWSQHPTRKLGMSFNHSIFYSQADRMPLLACGDAEFVNSWWFNSGDSHGSQPGAARMQDQHCAINANYLGNLFEWGTTTDRGATQFRIAASARGASYSNFLDASGTAPWAIGSQPISCPTNAPSGWPNTYCEGGSAGRVNGSYFLNNVDTYRRNDPATGWEHKMVLCGGASTVTPTSGCGITATQFGNQDIKTTPYDFEAQAMTVDHPLYITPNAGGENLKAELLHATRGAGSCIPQCDAHEERMRWHMADIDNRVQHPIMTYGTQFETNYSLQTSPTSSKTFDVQGVPVLPNTCRAPGYDTDNDGMADAWEAHMAAAPHNWTISVGVNDAAGRQFEGGYDNIEYFQMWAADDTDIPESRPGDPFVPFDKDGHDGTLLPSTIVWNSGVPEPNPQDGDCLTNPPT